MDELRQDVVRRFGEKLANGWTLDSLDAARGHLAMTDGENYFWLRIPASRIDDLLASGPAVFPEVEAAEGAARLLSIQLWESLNTRSSDPWATWHYGEGGFDPDQPGVSSVTERGQPF